MGTEHPDDLLLLLRALLLHVHVPQHSGHRIQGELAEAIKRLLLQRVAAVVLQHTTQAPKSVSSLF